MSGQTVEVINTDAEGRLILCDAMWYAQEKFKPQAMVELSTLTGAIIVALGHERAGLFSNNTQLSNRLRAAGAGIGEKMWRLPLGPKYDKMIDSDIADMRNVTNSRDASSITAAQFLQRFVQEVVAWPISTSPAWPGRARATARRRRAPRPTACACSTPGSPTTTRSDRQRSGVMATEVNFYHLTRSSLEDALPRLWPRPCRRASARW